VRSGILDSIHAFGASTLGKPFVVFIAVLAVGSIALVVARRDMLRSEHRLDSLLSREAMFLMNNVVLVGLCFVVFWGTFFPLISEAITGDKASVGPPWFNRYTVPLALLLVLLSGIGPVIAWRRATAANARRNFLVPVACAVVCAIALLPLNVAQKPLAMLMFAFGAFVFGAVGQELFRGARARRAMASESLPVAVVQLVRRNRQRWGGYTIHIGMAVLFIGVAASSAFQHTRDSSLVPGQTAHVDGYEVHYDKAVGEIANDPASTGAFMTLGAVLTVRKDGKKVGTLRPARNYYPGDASQGTVGQYVMGEATSEVGLKAGATRDFWVAVQPDAGWLNKVITKGNALPQDAAPLALQAIAARYAERPPPASFRMIASPLVTWIWLGGIIVMAGGLLALWPAPDLARRRVTAGLRARVAQELGRA
jgi:cytochrome c-type biogenesis protein CcmF